ncbi:MAG: carbohydrate kinase, partial [Microcystaceae cyanobacterium]
MAFLGIDFGTSGVRGTIINPEQEILWETSLSFSPAAEPNLPLLWQETLWELLAAIPVDVKPFLKAI